jgi:uncharacterized protein
VRRTLIAAVAALLAAPAAAQAHVTVQPDSAAPGGFTRLDVRVPNERDDAGTTKVDLQLPPGFISAAYEPVPGWKVTVSKRKLDAPVDAGEGFRVDEQVSRITWSGGVIEPGQFQDFGLSVRIPDGKAGDKLTFKALQTYQGGEVVRWIGPEDADRPAPTLTLAGAEARDHHATAATAAPAATAPAAGADDGGGSDTLAVIALAVGALGLIGALAALAAGRRREGMAA